MILRTEKVYFLALILGSSSVLRLSVTRKDIETEYAFYLLDVNELKDPNKAFHFSYKDLEKVSPNTLSCPMLRNKTEARILNCLYGNATILLSENLELDPWGWRSWQMFNETHEAALLKDCTVDSNLDEIDRLYEAKLIHHFDHRFATYELSRKGYKSRPFLSEEKRSPAVLVRTRYCLSKEIWDTRVADQISSRDWIMAFRRITNATNERTAIFTILPRCAAGSQTPVVATNQKPRLVAALLANLNSFVFDFAARRKVGGTDLNHFIIHQLPALAPKQYECLIGKFLIQDIVDRVLELVYTASDLQAFAIDCGYDGPPFRWVEERRFLIRCELDAIYFHLYGVGREDVDYIMVTFPIVKRKDERKYGEYRTKRVILECYDAMAEAMKTSRPYKTILDPPAADPRVAHPPLEDVTRAVMIDTAFPRTGTQRIICAAALELVHFAPDMPSEAYLDALYLASHPDHCEVLLPNAEKPKYRRAMKEVPQSLFLAEGQRMDWLRVREYLEMAGAIRIADRRGDQRLSGGPRCMEIRDGLPHGVDPIIPFALKAAEVLRAAQTDAQTRAWVSDNVLNQIRRQISQE